MIKDPETGIKKETVTSKWIHDREEDPKYVGGWKILPSCTCSNCGYHANREKPVCPKCGAIMDAR